MASDALRQDRDGEVLVLTIAHPPINAMSTVLRAALLEALRALDADDSLRGAVVRGEGSTFIAGADLREFGRPLEEPQLPQVLDAIERCRKPVVAAMHGAALGAGLELALSCDARIAAPGTVIGLPEVTLGILPGAGGTQRLPRVVGVARALELIGKGERIKAERALALGIVDAVATGDLTQAAVARVRELAGAKRRVSERPVPADAPGALEAAEAAVLKAGKRRPAVLAAVEAVKNAARLPFADGIALERGMFIKLRSSPEAYALRHLFFAERQAGRLPEGHPAAPRALDCVAVVGAGTMGSGIAIAALEAGLRVVLLDQDAAAATRGRDRVETHYAERVAAGKLAAAAAEERRARLVASADWAALSAADLVVEAVYEDLAVKQAVFRTIDAHARPGAVLATNTSYLDVDAIAAATSRPQDVLGLHFFSPANVMKLLEVVRARATAPDVLATGLALGKRLGKTSVVCGNAFGFIGNRLYNAWRRQCEFMLEEGAWPEEVDQALEAFGFAMGPFAVADLSGLDIAWRMRQAQAATRDARERYVDILDKLCEAGRLGRKAGAGYYRYVDGKRERASDEQVRAVIADASARRGLTRQPIAPAAIQRRVMLAMVNEAAQVLAEGVAARASDIDVVLALGYGFPRWEGGPVFWARRQDRRELERDIAQMVALSGHGFRAADLEPLLREAD
ncbi:3-hydroxyacyl-CoA dehydrogenase NAD-binding domain-containing protein [Ramlibacter sp. MAHUQ-53]|uniref:3-hydroxyacyl-CoA dehydrogenase NAD-binding domain-containing protein n=1 Tax=unclassified Ramlibacter TaxID=2617605 RepID=UPI00363F41E8